MLSRPYLTRGRNYNAHVKNTYYILIGAKYMNIKIFNLSINAKQYSQIQV